MVCFLQALVGYAVIFLSGPLVGRLLYWLRVQSRISGSRSVREIGVPVEIVGNFERLLAFVLVVFAGVAGAAPLGAPAQDAFSVGQIEHLEGNEEKGEPATARGLPSWGH